MRYLFETIHKKGNKMARKALCASRPAFIYQSQRRPRWRLLPEVGECSWIRPRFWGEILEYPKAPPVSFAGGNL